VVSTQTTDSLVFAPTAGGVYTVSLTVANASGNTATASTVVTVISDSPTLAAIPNQTVAAGKSLTLTLQGSDPNGLPLSYSATVDSLEYHLRGQLGLYYGGSLYYNWGGKNEEWLHGSGSSWYFILPSGAFYLWDGSNTATGTLVANLPVADYNDPSLLYNAQPGQGQATVSVSGAQLTITPNAGFTGVLYVTATVSDGHASASQAFQVTVTAANAPPTLAAIPDQTVAAGQSRTLTLRGTDPAGLPLTYSATVDSQEYHLRQQLGLYFSGSLWYNWGGKQEKWVFGSGGAQYFILPNGGFYLWNASNTAAGTLIA